jgi:hypothetical protein
VMPRVFTRRSHDVIGDFATKFKFRIARSKEPPCERWRIQNKKLGDDVAITVLRTRLRTGS